MDIFQSSTVVLLGCSLSSADIKKSCDFESPGAFLLECQLTNLMLNGPIQNHARPIRWNGITAESAPDIFLKCDPFGYRNEDTSGKRLIVNAIVTIANFMPWAPILYQTATGVEKLECFEIGSVVELFIDTVMHTGTIVSYRSADKARQLLLPQYYNLPFDPAAAPQRTSESDFADLEQMLPTPPPPATEPVAQTEGAPAANGTEGTAPATEAVVPEAAPVTVAPTAGTAPDTGAVPPQAAPQPAATA